jgi:hypothetical protein
MFSVKKNSTQLVVVLLQSQPLPLKPDNAISKDKEVITIMI